jgi:hypothetical protein
MSEAHMRVRHENTNYYYYYTTTTLHNDPYSIVTVAQSLLPCTNFTAFYVYMIFPHISSSLTAASNHPAQAEI